MDKKPKPILHKLVFVLLFPLWIWIVLLVLFIVIPFRIVFDFFRGLYLRYLFCTKWKAEGKFILFVYSNSPNWQEYIENNIFPKLQSHVVILNCSRKSEWKKNPTVESKVFKHWGGERDYNPMAVIFPKFGKVRTIRFFQAFKDYKHGKKDLLERQEALLFELFNELKTQFQTFQPMQ